MNAVTRYFKRTRWHDREPAMTYTSVGVALGLTNNQVREALRDYREPLTEAGFVWSSGWIRPAPDEEKST